MPKTYYDSELTGAQIESALEAIHGVVTPSNNGKVLYIEDGQIKAASASRWSGGAVLEPLSVTVNGDYTPPSGTDGFDSVHVAVPSATLTTKSITQNGTYNASQDNADGYSSVTVDVQGGSSAVVQPLSVTQNGTYNPPSGVDGYAPVTVNVSGGGILPNEYQRVLYVQNNNAYIDTGIAPDSNTTVYLQAVLSESNIMLFGSRNARNDGAFDLLFQPTASSSQRFRVDYGNTESVISQPSDMTFLDIVFGASGISVNGNTPASALTFSGNQYPISLFALNNAGSTAVPGSMKCFSFKIISGETTVRNFIPCRKKSDDEAGFYDLITSTFFGKSGSGTLIAGPDLN